ncbi:caffeoylshikimate esterase [Selaginella moellendorffii]|uniref:caffeoylshikimate esterase n=1 Tax=Selaginella moellendorffii TaxID=88036 RepID=UPI000D1C34EB|nr:caffeoylshikimate esterase [Selaginella moellendorffii]|eukprot:XP_024537665.1 caffeoylshikimate esterase [Selaginella moellendorffii]
MIAVMHDFVAMLVNGAADVSSSARSWSAAGALLVLLWIALATLLPPILRRIESHSSAREDGRSDRLQRNLDWATERRKIFADYEKVRRSLNIAGPSTGVVATEEFKVNSRGVELFTKSWLPESGQPKGLIFYCHGYGDTISFFFEGIARRLARAQYAVFGMDYEGFGLSSGLHGYIESFDVLVDDVIEHYSSIRERKEFTGLPCFLFGESMGGAIAIKAHLKQPKVWDGAVLVAPMCKIADDMYPPWILVQILKALVPVFPKSKLLPTRDLAAYAFKDPEKRKKAYHNVVGYVDRPRLRTAWELLVTTQEIESSMRQVSLPLLILHGGADKVTDPSVSKALYDNASSTDKRLYLYEGVYHGILEGEPDDTIDRVLADICSWLDLHSKQN